MRNWKPPSRTCRTATRPGACYALEGEFEWPSTTSPRKCLRVGETFYEPTESLHRVTKNPVAKGKTRVLKFIRHLRDAKQVTIPQPKRR
jgi:hypothetical protein